MAAMNLYAFFSYILLASFTPGPNNIMSMSGAGRYGFRKNFPFCLGMLLGTSIVMICCAAATSALFRFIPAIEPVMLYAGALYILWLALSVYRDGGNGKGADSGGSGRFFSGFALQFINVKVILYGMTAMSTFILPYHRSAPALAAAVMTLSVVGFAGTCCWAAFGAAFERIFNKHRKITNNVMALLLVLCAVSLLLK